ncbi:DUF2829 domain-containing protein [Larkinella sp.]|uniref:DUF2829 domain-containing protein n=1 Tax=Larkinella sp. TaxID=2034517 RepID=UPI003BAA920C
MNTKKMNFGQAIEAMKKGQLVQRVGWNGKGMHIYLEEHFGVILGKGGGMEHKRKYMPVIIMYTAQDTHQPGWNASTVDVLAEDWQVVYSNK